MSKTETTRRHVLAALPAVAAMLTAAPAVAKSDDPILPLFREWVAVRRAWVRLLNIHDVRVNNPPEIDALQDRENEVLEAILAIQPTTTEGIAVYLILLCDQSGDLDAGCRPDLPQSLEGRIIRTLWRGATGRDGWPPTGDLETLAGAWPEFAATLPA